MTKHKQKAAEQHAVEPDQPGAAPVQDRPPFSAAAPDPAPDHAAGALVEPTAEAVVRLEAALGEARTQLAQATDKYLRLAAEFDNYKKRAQRERMEQRARAQAEVVERLVDALDDLARFAHVDPGQTDAKTIHDGVDMVDRKFWKELEALGVTRIDQTGAKFDPHVHEAVTMAPAGQPAEDQTVGAVLQAGYKLGDTLLRPARVVVRTWQGEPAAPAGPASAGSGQ